MPAFAAVTGTSRRRAVRIVLIDSRAIAVPPERVMGGAMDLARAYAGTAPAWVDFFGNRRFARRASSTARDALHARGLRRAEQRRQGSRSSTTSSIAPRCPVRAGDRIEVRGEMVHDPGRPPVVHWTHHDPRAPASRRLHSPAREAVRVGLARCRMSSSSGIVTNR